MEQMIHRFRNLSPLTEADVQALLQVSREVVIGRNEILQPIGHTCRTIYYVLSGTLRIFYLQGDRDITESFEFENAVVARAESLFTGLPSRKGIQALENSRLVAIDSDRLFQLFNEHHGLERLFRKITEQAYVKTVNRLESLQFQGAEERYRQLLQEQPEILKRAPLKHVASYLGITQVSLSRIRAKREA